MLYFIHTSRQSCPSPPRRLPRSGRPGSRNSSARRRCCTARTGRPTRRCSRASARRSRRATSSNGFWRATWWMRPGKARSTGPSSAAGKARASRDALSQGLFAGFEGDLQWPQAPRRARSPRGEDALGANAADPPPRCRAGPGVTAGDGGGEEGARKNEAVHESVIGTSRRRQEGFQSPGTPQTAPHELE